MNAFMGYDGSSTVRKVSQIYNLTHHMGNEFSSFLWTLHGCLKHVLPA